MQFNRSQERIRNQERIYILILSDSTFIDGQTENGI
jgi:hypothetical protein